MLGLVTVVRQAARDAGKAKKTAKTSAGIAKTPLPVTTIGRPSGLEFKRDLKAVRDKCSAEGDEIHGNLAERQRGIAERGAASKSFSEAPDLSGIVSSDSAVIRIRIRIETPKTQTLRNNPDPPILASFDFLAFSFFSDFPCFFEVFLLAFPRILGVLRREKPLLFRGLSFFQMREKARVGGLGIGLESAKTRAISRCNSCDNVETL